MYLQADFVQHNYQDNSTSSAVLIKLCRLCDTVQRTEWSPWKPVRHKTHLYSLKSLSNNLFNIIKSTAACHCHDTNPYWQINGEDWEGGERHVINHQLRTSSELQLKSPPRSQNSCYSTPNNDSPLKAPSDGSQKPSHPCQLLHTSSVGKHEGILNSLDIPCRIAISLQDCTPKHWKTGRAVRIPPPITNCKCFARFHTDSS